MMSSVKSKYIFSVLLCVAVVLPWRGEAVDLSAPALVPTAEVLLSPRTGTFVQDSTFEVPIFINTKGSSVNGIEIRVNYDKDKLSIIKQSGGTSIIGVWVEPPRYDNTKGIASYVGVVPNGITTQSGLIGTITFKALATGRAVVSVSSNSALLLNDGLGTAVRLDLGRSEYVVTAKAPEGVEVFSETHQFQGQWYNNNNPVLSWIKDPEVSGFSFVLDDKPSTIPDNTVDSEQTTTSFENLKDGLWYFHIKAQKGGVWGTTGHFLVRIDTTPPAEFTPEVNYLLAALATVERSLVSFFTTDNLSGIDHYEVGIIDKNQPVTESPVFIQSESPFQVPIQKGSSLEVIVRAIDKAGNVRDASISVKPPFVLTQVIKDNLVSILSLIILLGLIILIIHYLVGHHILRYMKKVFLLMRKEEAQAILKEEGIPPPVILPTVSTPPTDTKEPPTTT